MIIREITHGTADYDQEVDLRLRVLRIPLGMTYAPEQLAAEVSDLHLGIFDGSKITGCLILTKIDVGTVKMRQVAIDPSVQGRGVGRKLVEHSEKLARSKGYREMQLNARDTAVAFYLALGYEATGDPFLEIGIPHRTMRKTL